MSPWAAALSLAEPFWLEREGFRAVYDGACLTLECVFTFSDKFLTL